MNKPLFNFIIIILFVLSTYLYYNNYYNWSIFLTLGNLLLIYFTEKKIKADKSKWLAHPIRLLLPLFIISQSLMYLFFLLSEIINVDGYVVPSSYLFDDYYIPEGFAGFLLLHSIFIYGLSVSFKPKSDNGNLVKSYDFANNNIYIIMIMVVLISLVDYIYIYTPLISLPAGISHILQLFSRLRPLFAIFIVNHLWNKKSKYSLIILFVFIIVYFYLGFLSVSLTGMRQLLFEICIILLIVYLTIKRSNFFRISSFLKYAAVFIIFLYIFNLASNLKFDNRTEYSGELITHRILNSLYDIAFRGSGYVGDMTALSKSQSFGMIKNNSNIIFSEILNGIPLGSLVFNLEKKSKYSFNMLFYWSYSPVGFSSAYISGPSSLLFLYGMLIILPVMLFVGIIHGKTINWVYKNLNLPQWVVIQSFYLLFFLFGLQRVDLIGLPVYLVIATLILNIMISKDNSRINSNHNPALLINQKRNSIN